MQCGEGCGAAHHIKLIAVRQGHNCIRGSSSPHQSSLVVSARGSGGHCPILLLAAVLRFVHGGDRRASEGSAGVVRRRSRLCYGRPGRRRRGRSFSPPPSVGPRGVGQVWVSDRRGCECGHVCGIRVWYGGGGVVGGKGQGSGHVATASAGRPRVGAPPGNGCACRPCGLLTPQTRAALRGMINASALQATTVTDVIKPDQAPQGRKSIAS